MEGRGFDECGEKGFVLLELEEQIHSRFVPFAKRKIQERFVDISATNNRYEAYLRAKEKVENAKDLYRLILIGEVAYESDGLAEEIAQMLDGACYFVNVKNKTTQKLYARDYEGDTSLRGEFVRKVLQKDWSEEKKYRVLQMGLKALSRREVD